MTWHCQRKGKAWSEGAAADETTLQLVVTAPLVSSGYLYYLKLKETEDILKVFGGLSDMCNGASRKIRLMSCPASDCIDIGQGYRRLLVPSL